MPPRSHRARWWNVRALQSRQPQGAAEQAALGKCRRITALGEAVEGLRSRAQARRLAGSSATARERQGSVEIALEQRMRRGTDRRHRPGRAGEQASGGAVHARAARVVERHG
jgi:hypothetical protein